MVRREEWGIAWNLVLDGEGLLVSERIELELELEALYQPDQGRA